MRHIQPQICQHGFVVLFFLLSLPGKGADKGPTAGYDLSAQSVSVASGLCVEIPCTFTVSGGSTLYTNVTGIWYRTGTPDIVAVSTNASMVSEGTKGRFTLTGKVQKGNCSFSISNAQPADQGVYVFRIEDVSHKYSYIWDKLSVSVTDLPEPTISPVGELIAGKPITLTCTAHPAPQGCKGIITWGGRINIKNISNYEREDQAGKVTSISDITVTQSQREHNSPLTCTVTYSGVSTNSSITLDVQYPPSLTITVPDAPRSPAIWDCTSAGCRVEVTEGTSLSLLCSAESNPPANLSWEKMGQSSTDPLNSSSGRLNVGPVAAHNEGEYMCRARNKHGDSTASAIVVIIYAPRRLTITYCNITDCSVHESSVEVQEGNSLYLRCDADSNPVANVVWVKRIQNGTITQISLTAQLNVTHVTAENEGNYTCQTMNRVGNSSKSISVVLIKTHTNDAIHLAGIISGGIFVLLLAAIVTVLVIKKMRRPPEQAEESKNEESKRSPTNNVEGLYAKIRKKPLDEPNMSPSSPNEGESPDEDVQYVSLHFSTQKPKSSPEPEEILYSEVKRN